MTPSSPSFSSTANLRRGPARPLSVIGTILFALLIVLAGYVIGRQVLLNGQALFG